MTNISRQEKCLQLVSSKANFYSNQAMIVNNGSNTQYNEREVNEEKVDNCSFGVIEVICNGIQILYYFL